MKKTLSPKERLIFALDVNSIDDALKWVALLKDYVGLFKIGKEFFTACGPDAVKAVHDQGGKVFLDLKFHDIPNTTAMAGVSALRLGVAMFNLHSLGGLKMMETTREAIDHTCQKEERARPIILAVTILTSLDEDDIKEAGIKGPVWKRALDLAMLANRAGLDGVVASPKEVKVMREEISNDFIIVTPGIRLADAGAGGAKRKDDQKRAMTPGEAIREGSDYIVVGRPIRNAKDPVAVAEQILLDIEKNI